MFEYTLVSKEFSSNVRYTYEMPEVVLEDVKKNLINISNNQITFIN